MTIAAAVAATFGDERFLRPVGRSRRVSSSRRRRRHHHHRRRCRHGRARLFVDQNPLARVDQPIRWLVAVVVVSLAGAVSTGRLAVHEKRALACSRPFVVVAVAAARARASQTARFVARTCDVHRVRACAHAFAAKSRRRSHVPLLLPPTNDDALFDV